MMIAPHMLPKQEGVPSTRADREDPPFHNFPEGAGESVLGPEEQERSRAVAAACAEALELVAKFDRIPELIRNKLRRFSTYARQRGLQIGDAIEAERLAIATVGVIDILVTNNMRAHGDGSKYGPTEATYLRSKNYESYLGSPSQEGNEPKKQVTEELIMTTQEEATYLDERLRSHLRAPEDRPPRQQAGNLKVAEYRDAASMLAAVAKQKKSSAYYVEQPLSPREIFEITGGARWQRRTMFCFVSG